MRLPASLAIGLEIVFSSALAWLAFNLFLRGETDPVTLSELVKTLGSLSTISGSMLGWSAGIIGGAKSQLLDLDYSQVDDTLNQITQIHENLFVRWGCVVLLSTCAVVLATIGTPTPKTTPNAYWLKAATCIETACLWQIFRIFQKLRTLLDAKTKLDKHERAELKARKRVIPDSSLPR